MSAQVNKELVRTIIDQVWNAGRVDRLPEFFHDELQDDAAGLHALLTAAFPDLHIRIEDLVAEEDRVAATLTFAGTHRGPFRGIEPTGRPVRFGAIRIYRFADGKVTETWAQQDALGLLGQIRG